MWPDLWWNSQIDLSVWKCIYASCCEKYDVVEHFTLLDQKLLAEALKLLKSNFFLLTYPEKVKILTNVYGCQIGYGWIQNILNIALVFVAKLFSMGKWSGGGGFWDGEIVGAGER